MASSKGFDIRDYMWHIYEISAANEVGNIRFALDMLIINMETGMERYEGASELDYTALHDEWDKFSEAEKIYQKIIFHKVIHKVYFNLSDAWRAKDRPKFEKLCYVDLTMLGVRGTDPNIIIERLPKKVISKAVKKENSPSIEEPPKKRGRPKKIKK